MRIFYVICTVVLVSSCMKQVTMLDRDESKSLGLNKGYVLFGVQTNRDLRSIHISGAQSIRFTSKDIRRGTNYLLAELRAGTYTIDGLLLDRKYALSLRNDDYWRFKISAGQINYVGHLEVVRSGYFSPSTEIELVNRSSEALEFMEKNYPNVLAGLSIVYGGPGDDDFFEFLASEVNK